MRFCNKDSAMKMERWEAKNPQKLNDQRSKTPRSVSYFQQRHKRRGSCRWVQLSWLNPAPSHCDGSRSQSVCQTKLMSSRSEWEAVKACWSNSHLVSAPSSLSATAPQQVGESVSADASSVSSSASAALQKQYTALKKTRDVGLVACAWFQK